ncbi:threonine synthase [Tepiditoga spiralis]|uniref:Threonine synthase n=1 Tax=Tepiditoga spiralis TaxID=2108365 RepID=A0A7G1G962_9BACT|nr:threonine synthase [Tepiditoga spiralis]BBE30612.1 threonine synthase [Tepiditoga spiralis]
MKYKLKCISCGQTFEKDEVEYTCPKCGNRLGTLEVIYDYDSINIKKSDFEKNAPLWQFEKILPIEKNSYKTHLYVGGTPLYKFKNFDGVDLLIKYDGSNPTGSYKDRASAIAVTKAIEKNYDTIYCASTGNAASSLAGISAPTKLKTHIFLPASAPIAKISQLFVYGANVIAIDGSYDKAFDISLEIGNEKGWYCRNSAINPYLLEGKKTGALEIIVQNDFIVPEYIMVSVGDGTVISSLYKGFYDFYMTGITNKIPKIIGVQAENAASIKKAFEDGEPFKPHDLEAKTIADSISVGKPRDVIKACKYVKKSKGTFISVSDSEIIEAIGELAVKTGIFSEPAGAVPYAGFKKLNKNKFFNGSVCIVVTGNGLKDIKAVDSFVDLKVYKHKEDIKI